MKPLYSPTVVNAEGFCPTSVDKVVLQKSIPAQIRQLILYDHLSKEHVDGFVRELTLEKQHYEHCLWDEVGLQSLGIISYQRASVLFTYRCTSLIRN